MIYKIIGRLSALAAIALGMIGITSCEDEMSAIGSKLGKYEVIIQVDSLFQVTGKSVYSPDFDPRSNSMLLGRISAPEYGDLSCTFMSQMLASSSLNIPDSIDVSRVDSMKMVIQVPRRALTGDSLAPQQLKVYQLTKPLTKSDDNKYNPAEYISQQSLLGKRSYTLTALGLNDSIYIKSKSIDIPVRLNTDFARKIFTDYRNDPSIFQWQSTFSNYFAGIYVEPSFGRGCIANISKVMAIIYYYRLQEYREMQPDSTFVTKVRHAKDSTVVFSTAPEVLTVNNVSMKISDNITNRVANGETLVLSPAGYNLEFRFPLPEIIDKYDSKIPSLTVVDNLTFELPASEITNDYGITVPPTLLMVKTSELPTFFSENKTPDGKIAFWARYNTATKSYTFDSMRQYFLDAVENRDKLTEDDYNFTIVPVSLITQEKYVSYQQTDQIVTGCTPYVERPSMGIIHLDKAIVKFTYSHETIL